MKILQITEVPLGYSIACGLSTIGATLRRNVFIDQVKFKVYPALRVILIGKSGIGKDTAIDTSIECLEQITMSPRIFSGRTYERILDQLAKTPPPHTGFIAAQELAAFLGMKDYQQGMMEGLTKILSDKEGVLDESTKKNPNLKLISPTLTIQAGSTPEWLHNAVPKGALDGGFIPRFLVVFEEDARGHKALIKRDTPPKEIREAKEGQKRFVKWLDEMSMELSNRNTPLEINLLTEAADLYTKWYVNRTKYFPPTVRTYAERCRNEVLRIALLMALSRDHQYIEELDVQFGIDLMGRVTKKLDDVLLPPTLEGQCAKQIYGMLPITRAKLIGALAGKKYNRYTINSALDNLIDSKQVLWDGKTYRKNV